MNHSLSSCSLPPQMAKACKSFEQFYLSRHSGRRLTWQYSLGNAQVNVKFKSRSYELTVATFALVILLLFEDVKDDEHLTYSVGLFCVTQLEALWLRLQEIKTLTEMDESELKRHLQSLACAKYKVLKKHPTGRDINPTDEFFFNNDFSCALNKIKIATVSSKLENNVERKETWERIDEERKYVMEVRFYCLP